MKNSKYYWPLNVSTFTFWDKCKIFWWLVKEPIWTSGKWVERYEKKWSNYTKCPHVIAVSSGSAANELIALRRKHELELEGNWPKKNKAIFCGNSWISNCSVFINLNFEPIFVDATLLNLCASIRSIEIALLRNPDVGTVFYTTLLGYSENIYDLIELCKKYNVKLMLDNCESSFSKQFDDVSGNQISFNNFVTSSVSCYFSHHTSGNGELGLIFCQNEEEADWFRMMRNHGMTRGMPSKYRNKEVDAAFDFYLMGSNYRTTNLGCYMALLDFDRAEKFSREQRINISNYFYHHLDQEKFECSQGESATEEGRGLIPLALPIIVKQKANRPDLIDKVKGYLAAKSCETRGIIGGFLGVHTAFKKYNLKPEDYPRCMWMHKNGIYLGLNIHVSLKMAKEIAQGLSKL